MKIKVQIETAVHDHDLKHVCQEMMENETLFVLFKGVLEEKRLVMHIKRPRFSSQKNLMIDLLKGTIEHLQSIPDLEEMIH